VWLDVRLALRRLGSRPVPTAIMILMMTLGIGATTAVYSVADSLLFRRVPFLHPERLVEALDFNRSARGGGSSLTPEKIVGWQAQTAIFERFEAFSWETFDIGGEAEPQRVTGALVSNTLFSMLGVQARLGRLFDERDGSPGTTQVVVIGEGLWRTRYGGRADVVGRTLELNDVSYIIVGVAPRRFHLLGIDALWTPLNLHRAGAESGATRFYGLGRLASGLNAEAAQRRADVVATALQISMPLTRSWDLRLRPKLVATVSDRMRTSLLVLLGAVGLVLLITCANVANLLLSRSIERAHEVAVRAALGASRGRIARDVLIESAAIASCGGALGVVAAAWGVPSLLHLVPSTAAFSNTTTIEIDARVLVFATAATLLTAVLFGAVPALRGSAIDFEGTLRGGRHATGGRGGWHMQDVLVGAEMALSVILLVGAMLMMRTLVALQSKDPGFDPANLIAMHIDLPSDRYPTPAARQAFFDQIEARVATAPGVQNVAHARGLPPTFSFSFGTPAVDGAPAPRSGESVTISSNVVSPNYFKTLRMPIVAGRSFDEIDDDAIVVSRSVARRYWPDRPAIGHQFRLFERERWQTVVGVVDDVDTVIGERVVAMQIYRPFANGPADGTRSIARSKRDYVGQVLLVRGDEPLGLIAPIKKAVWSVDRNQPIERIALAEDLYAESFGQQRFTLVLMSIFAAIAVMIASAGLFGVLSELVTRRSREIAIRIALGATPNRIAWLVTSRGVAVAGVGTVAGIAGAAALTRVLDSLLVGVSHYDATSFCATAIFLMLIALIACWTPTRRAAAIEPAASLRAD
jgi:putative ABC transport system permease protein